MITQKVKEILEQGSLSAGFPMYQNSKLDIFHQKLISFLQSDLALRGAPISITLEAGCDDIGALWRNPGLIIGQSCMFPLTHEYKASLDYLATPHYDVPGCQGPYYRSFIVTHARNMGADYQTLVERGIAINSADSLSGGAAMASYIKDLQDHIPANPVITGAHRKTLEAIAKGHAALGVIDCVTWHYMKDDIPTGIQIIDETPSYPALPYVISQELSPAFREAARALLVRVPDIPDLAQSARQANIKEFSLISKDQTRQIAQMTPYPV